MSVERPLLSESAVYLARIANWICANSAWAPALSTATRK